MFRADALAASAGNDPERFGSIIFLKSLTTTNLKKTRRKLMKRFDRPDAMRAPEDVRKYLEDDLFKLYQLIWQRFRRIANCCRDFRSNHD